MLKKVPHTYVIIFFLIVICALLTWLIPGGEFERESVIVNGVERSVIKSGSFHETESQLQTWQIFSSFFDGFLRTSDIIALILLIGGSFWILNDSKSIDIGIFSFLKSIRRLEKSKILATIGVQNIVLVGIMTVFSLFGAIFGMSEETIAFTIIFVPLAISMGYDSIVGVSLCFVAAAMGFAGAFLNPFTVGVAQGLSHIPLFSGLEYRILMWVIINFFGFAFILRYAAKIKKDPSISVVYEDDAYWRSRSGSTDVKTEKIKPTVAWIAMLIISVALILFSFVTPESSIAIGNKVFNIPAIPVATMLFIVMGIITLRHSVQYFILSLLTFTIVFLVIGVMGHGWYIKEISTIFLAMGIFAGVAANKSPNAITKLFLDGAKDILPAALIVGLARGIVVILEDGKIIDTILFYVSDSMQNFGEVGTVGIMYLIQTMLNVFIPSGSGQAALTIPIMSQISDLIGISRQTTVVIFQLGDGFTNMITPTSGVLIGVLGVARIPYEKWFKWAASFILMLIVIGFLLILPTVFLELNGF
ncbi:YfcC family protein [Draconibacterium sp. IB214405]|uniref:YfcC family protein n=1 Tax=Draconibacterium sp. IB214405 TaxID=3097352 RepID=UPI002A0FF829|nr:AbgT family transporter [Draconibacterium sp. IB214405]MDX8340496.1 YfcC family protein [Draconibacterium sp. IB214405]